MGADGKRLPGAVQSRYGCNGSLNRDRANEVLPANSPHNDVRLRARGRGGARGRRRWAGPRAGTPWLAQAARPRRRASQSSSRIPRTPQVRLVAALDQLDLWKAEIDRRMRASDQVGTLDPRAARREGRGGASAGCGSAAAASNRRCPPTPRRVRSSRAAASRTPT